MIRTATAQDADLILYLATVFSKQYGVPSIALGQLTNGFSRHGEELLATSPTRGQKARVRVMPPHFYDVSGERYRD